MIPRAPRNRHPTCLSAIVTLTVALALAAMASARAGDDHHGHDKLRSAVENGQILSLAEIVKIAVSHTGGQVIDTELDEDDDRLIYELRVLTPSGRVLEVVIDAATGRIVEIDDD
ncbi:PepSY domain-containing protein [Rhizobium sp. G187]|uniref:PepSY domain-containing protein n=1 Tax=Rhizobium sp. G187 TaxID=3451352 RepID=UPI003EE61C9A